MPPGPAGARARRCRGRRAGPGWAEPAWARQAWACRRLWAGRPRRGPPVLGRLGEARLFSPSRCWTRRCWRLCGGLPADRARHAPGPAPAAGKLTARHRDDLDSRGLQRRVGVHVALIGDHNPRRDRQHVAAVVPLPAARRDRIHAGIDDLEPVDPHGLRGGLQEWLGRDTRNTPGPSARTVIACAVSVYAAAGNMTTVSTSTIVQTVSRCTDSRCRAIGTARTVCASPASNMRRARRSTPAGAVRQPVPTATTPGASSSTSPPSSVSRPGRYNRLVPANRGWCA